MKRLVRAAALAALLCGPAIGPASAEDEPDCTDPITQFDLNFCANADFEAADKELNAVWKDARAKAKAIDDDETNDMWKGAEKALLAAQRGWIPFRDGSCELAGFEARGGSMEPMIVSGCLAQMTRARTEELRQFIRGPE